MTDEQENFAETEQAVPAIEAQGDEHDAPVADDEGEELSADAEQDGEDAEGGDELPPEEDEEVDLDFAFGKYRVPRKLHDAVKGLEKTFTQKTQAFNEQVRDLTAKATQRAEANEEQLAVRAQLHTIGAEIKRFENWDWAAYQQARQVDPITADEAWNYKQHLTQTKSQLEGTLKQLDDQRSQEAQQDFAKRVEETRQFAQDNIKGWSPEVDAKLLTFAQQMQIPEDFIRSNLAPVFYNMLHKAWVGEQALKKQAAAITPQPRPQPKPATQIRPRTNPGARKSVSEWTVEDHARAEQDRLRRKS
jgi:hypothetical protein